MNESLAILKIDKKRLSSDNKSSQNTLTVNKNIVTRLWDNWAIIII